MPNEQVPDTSCAAPTPAPNSFAGRRSQRGRTALGVAAILIALGISGCATQPKITRASIDEVITRGDDAVRQGDLNRAMIAYVEALARDPRNVSLLNKVGEVHSLKGELRRARQTFEQAIAIEQNPASLEGLGFVLLKERQHDEAERYLAMALAQGDRWRSHNGLGVINDLRGDFKASKSHFIAALRLRPDDARLRNNLGYSLYLAGEWKAAIEHFRGVVADDRKNIKAWSNLGLAYVRVGDYTKALHAFRQILKPAEAYNSVGYLCMVNGRHEEAEGFLRQAILVSPSYYAAAERNLANARMYRGEQKNLLPTSSKH